MPSYQSPEPQAGILAGVDFPNAYGLAFAAASIAFCLHSLFAARLGIASGLVGILGNATCGWSWLATRSLFRRPGQRRALWPIGAVLLVMAGAALASPGPAQGLASRVLANLAALASSTMLLLAMAEPLLDLPAQRDRAEQRFRIAYAGCYAAILAVAVLAVDGAPPGSLAARAGIAIKAAAAILAACGFGIAHGYRRRHPLADAPRAMPRKPALADPALRDELLRLLGEERLYTDPELHVGELARRAGQPEYKVTRCITGALGYPNFNRLVNRYRIEEAKRRLRDPALAHLPILTIALDCGFGSIGPFNRAFKAETGISPREFRSREGASRSINSPQVPKNPANR